MRLALLSALLILTSCSAQPPPPRTQGQIDAAISLAQQAFSVVEKTRGGASIADIQGDVAGMSTAAIAAVHDEGHGPAITTATAGRDAISAATARACGESNAIELADIAALSERIVLRMASPMTECASEVSLHLRTVSSLEAVEDIGFAVNIVYPVAIAVQARAGLTTAGLLDDYRVTNEVLIAKLAPKCREWTRAAAHVVEVHYECVAHDRAKAHGVEIYEEGRHTTAPLNRKAIDAEATRLTSRAVALATLPKLDALTRRAGEQIL